MTDEFRAQKGGLADAIKAASLAMIAIGVFAVALRLPEPGSAQPSTLAAKGPVFNGPSADAQREAMARALAAANPNIGAPLPLPPGARPIGPGVGAPGPVTAVAPAVPADFDAVIRAWVQQTANAKLIYDEVGKALQEERNQKQAMMAQNMPTFFAKLTDPAAAPVFNPKGTIPLVYVFDNNCGACKQQAPILEAFAKANPNVRIHYWEFPILGPNSVESAKAALAVWKMDASKYEAIHKAFKAEAKLDPTTIQAAIKKIGMDPDAVMKRAAESDITQMVEANRQMMAQMGVQGTPFLYLAPQTFPGVTQQPQLEEALKRFVAPKAPTQAAQVPPSAPR